MSQRHALSHGQSRYSRTHHGGQTASGGFWPVSILCLLNIDRRIHRKEERGKVVSAIRGSHSWPWRCSPSGCTAGLTSNGFGGSWLRAYSDSPSRCAETGCLPDWQCYRCTRHEWLLGAGGVSPYCMQSIRSTLQMPVICCLEDIPCQGGRPAREQLVWFVGGDFRQIINSMWTHGPPTALCRLFLKHLDPLHPYHSLNSRVAHFNAVCFRSCFLTPKRHWNPSIAPPVTFQDFRETIRNGFYGPLGGLIVALPLLPQSYHPKFVFVSCMQ